MYKNYLKIAWRTLWKNKVFTLINIVGLSIAFGVAILLAMAGYFELSYENFHKNKDHLFEVYAEQQTNKGPEVGTTQPTPFAAALQNEVPGIERITRILNNDALVSVGEKEMSLDAVWVDNDFFSMFTFPLVHGNNGDELKDLNSVVLTENAAKKLFGKTDIIDKTVNIMLNGKEQPFSVGAIAKNIPSNTDMRFEMAVRFENNPRYVETKDTWDNQYHQVYVQLERNISSKEFIKNTRPFVNLHYKGSIENAKRDGAVPNAAGLFREIKLLPLKDIRFTNFRKGYAEVSRSGPFIVLGIAFLILFIACVNFINMSIAKSAQRLKEIGMRKTLGAKRKQLFFQFWGESLFVFIGASAIGTLLSVLLLDDFKSIFRTGATLDILSSPIVIGAFILGMLSITFIVGGYPAFLLSRLGAVQSLKGKLEVNGKNRLRNVLIVLQFSIATLLITGTLVLRKQIDFMRNKDLGYDKEQVISFPLNGKKNSYADLELLKNELSGNPDIISVSGADNNLGRGRDGTQSSSNIGFEYKGRMVGTNFLVVDYEYQKTLGLKMAMGRGFESAADSLGVLINEAMARQLEEEDPLSAQLGINEGTNYPVLGVVKDYNFQGLDRAVAPITFFMGRDLELTYAYVKVAPTNMAKSMETVEKTWKKIEPNAKFLGSFLDENIDRTFRREKSLATLVTSGSVIAIILSCIGLFAMSMLIVSQRTKEIGIRKVVGAGVLSIVYILTKDFLKLVLIAFLIASPIAWWFLKEWLQNYAYHIELGLWFFVASGIIVLLIAFLTISARTIKAANANPVKSLRTE